MRPRKSKKPRGAIGMAVKALRESLGMTQQRFAQETGAAINSIARYETGRRPKALMLRKFEELAVNNQEFVLAAVFGQALQQEIGIRVFDSTSPYLPQTQNEAQAIVVLLEMMRNPKYEKQLKLWARIAKRIDSGRPKRGYLPLSRAEGMVKSFLDCVEADAESKLR